MKNISFEEAKLRFKPGDKFVVNDGIGKYGQFLPGDIVKLKEFYMANGWGIVCDIVERAAGTRHGYHGWENLSIHSSYLETIRDGPGICTCDILLGPCTCGAFQKEKEDGYVAKRRDKHTYF